MTSTMLTVTLTKTTAGPGLPAGETYTWTYVSWPLEKAVNCARRALKREYPGERSEDWEVQP